MLCCNHASGTGHEDPSRRLLHSKINRNQGHGIAMGRYSQAGHNVSNICIFYSRTASNTKRFLSLSRTLWPLKYEQVSVDGGVLGLDRVFELISKGECLPVSCEKELKVIKHCNTIMAIALYCYPEIVVGAVIEG